MVSQGLVDIAQARVSYINLFIQSNKFWFIILASTLTPKS